MSLNDKIINFDINRNNLFNLTAKQYDTDGARSFTFRLLKNSVPFSLEGLSVKVGGKKPDGKNVFNDCIIKDAKKGIVEVELTTQMQVVAGDLNLELIILKDSTRLSTIPFEVKVIQSATCYIEVQSSDEFQALQDALWKTDNVYNKSQIDNFTWSMSNMGQDVKEAMTGGSVAVVGKDAIDSINLRDNSVTRDKVTNDVLSLYPFQPRATLKHNKTNNESIEILKKAIKRIDLYNTDGKRKYFINYINRSNDGNNILTINIKNDLDVLVASIDQWYFTFENGIQKVILYEKNTSGIHGYIYIDFSIFTSGKGYYGMEFNETGICQECLHSFKEPIEKNEWVKISLPSKIYGVVDQELNIYFDNIILCNDLSNYQVNVECEKGIQQNERWTYTPESSGNFNLTIEVFKDGKTLIERKTVLISIKSKTGTGMKKALFIGDSLTDYNQYIQEIVNLFSKDECDIKLLGTKGWNEQARHEGRSGWDTDDYANNPSYNGVVNPFWNPSSSKFDFNYYLLNNNVEIPDIIVFMLGTNDVGRNVPNDNTIENLKKMIDNIKITKSDIKFGIALTPPPGASQDGFGKFNQCWATMFQTKQGNFELAERYIYEFDNKIENISVIPVNINLDTVNNFEYEEVKANSRSTVIIKRMNNNVHPAQSGMYQFADTYYGWLKNFY